MVDNYVHTLHITLFYTNKHDVSLGVLACVRAYTRLDNNCLLPIYKNTHSRSKDDVLFLCHLHEQTGGVNETV